MSYPKKMLAPDGTTTLAKQAVHEAELRAEGYEDAPAETTVPAPSPEAPTSCAKCAGLQAEVDRLTVALAEAWQPQAGETSAPTKRGRPAKA